MLCCTRLAVVSQNAELNYGLPRAVGVLRSGDIG